MGCAAAQTCITICAVYYSPTIIRVRCTFHPPPRFDTTGAAFPLIIQYKSISASLVGSPPILGSMGVAKFAWNSSTFLFPPAVMSRNLGSINGGFVPWENWSNLLKR